MRFLGWLFGTIILIAIFAAGAGAFGYTIFIKPGPLRADVAVVIPRGVGINAITGLLEQHQIIDDPTIFRVAARLMSRNRQLQAGEYAFPRNVSQQQVIGILQSGKTVVRRITLAEGLSTAEVMERLRNTEGLSGPVTLRPSEGDLLPETYHFSFGDSRDELVRRMQQAMDRTVAAAWARRAPGLPLKSPREALILASIVEKETGRPDERARVAGVFVNRLKLGMRLQSDPTVSYGLTGGQAQLERPLTRTDLETETPYNTYVISGLPPGPISNPGAAAIEAALNPVVTEDLYFVADGKGGHAFARNLAQHNRNVRRWRELQREEALKAR